MPPSRQAEITRLLDSLRTGEQTAWDELLPLIYDELYRIAHRQRRQNHADWTLNTTALVHEAFLKLSGKEQASWNDRMHFYRVAARAMRDVIVDYARRQRAARRGGGAPRLSLEEVGELPDVNADEVLALDEALKRLEAIDPRQSRVVELRYFVGLTYEETAAVLDVSVSTAQRAWLSARAWLYREMQQ